MTKKISLKVDGVSKKFCRSLKRAMVYAVKDVSRELLHLPLLTQQLRQDEFWAVDNVSFKLESGECLGVIGLNGAGKSTLLKMINGIVPPDKGRITLCGKVGALIEVGAGFHPMLTGRENIYINGAVLGMRKREIDRKFDEIVDFAEIEEFLDTPVKFYSNGMYVRLGFSIASHLEPDILLIDEVLAVGDNKFRAKCTRKLARAVQNGAALLFVSHDMNEIVRVCQQTLWLEKGKTSQIGTTSAVVGAYLTALDRDESQRAEYETPLLRSGARLRQLLTCGADGNPKTTFRTGEPMIVQFDYEKLPHIPALTFSFAMSLGDEKSYVSCHSAWEGFAVGSAKDIGRVTLTIPNLLLNSGHYLLNVGIWDQDFQHAYDWRWGFCHIDVTNEHEKLTGRFVLPHQWSESDDSGCGFANPPNRMVR